MSFDEPTSELHVQKCTRESVTGWVAAQTKTLKNNSERSGYLRLIWYWHYKTSACSSASHTINAKKQMISKFILFSIQKREPQTIPHWIIKQCQIFIYCMSLLKVFLSILCRHKSSSIQRESASRGEDKEPQPEERKIGRSSVRHDAARCAPRAEHKDSRLCLQIHVFRSISTRICQGRTHQIEKQKNKGFYAYFVSKKLYPKGPLI